ncbi:hypothetical protein FIBSPDRAFT_939366 [Athelia psychrophila]|uniref:Uncharacterized protein n=1 Tax=Athelia psychrophila TaxID=1759441 RepID=A0A165WKK0_9AGAM|nr:hypothetical protein FIBSPDRAFT_939366 [Fibularhizoctonia sp. CBS 109695]
MQRRIGRSKKWDNSPLPTTSLCAGARSTIARRRARSHGLHAFPPACPHRPHPRSSARIPSRAPRSPSNQSLRQQHARAGAAQITPTSARSPTSPIAPKGLSVGPFRSPSHKSTLRMPYSGLIPCLGLGAAYWRRVASSLPPPAHRHQQTGSTLPSVYAATHTSSRGPLPQLFPAIWYPGHETRARRSRLPCSALSALPPPHTHPRMLSNCPASALLELRARRPACTLARASPSHRPTTTTQPPSAPQTRAPTPQSLEHGARSGAACILSRRRSSSSQVPVSERSRNAQGVNLVVSEPPRAPYHCARSKTCAIFTIARPPPDAYHYHLASRGPLRIFKTCEGALSTSCTLKARMPGPDSLERGASSPGTGILSWHCRPQRATRQPRTARKTCGVMLDVYEPPWTLYDRAHSRTCAVFVIALTLACYATSLAQRTTHPHAFSEHAESRTPTLHSLELGAGPSSTGTSSRTAADPERDVRRPPRAIRTCEERISTFSSCAEHDTTAHAQEPPARALKIARGWTQDAFWEGCITLSLTQLGPGPAPQQLGVKEAWRDDLCSDGDHGGEGGGQGVRDHVGARVRKRMIRSRQE